MEGEVPTWSSSASNVATVNSNGLVTAISDGTTTITVSLGILSTTFVVTVEQMANSITVTPSSLSFGYIGELKTSISTITDFGGATMPNASVMWSSSDTNVVTVSSNGEVLAVDNGTATITGTVDSLSIAIVVDVTALFYLHNNGVTIMCPDANIGGSGEVNGIIYTKRDRVAIDNLVINEDWISLQNTCTSGITNMDFMFAEAYFF